MPKKAPPPPPEVLEARRTLCLLEGVVQSRSDPERQYRPRIILQANILDTCDGSIMQDSLCVHVKALLETQTKEQLIQWILDSHTIPEPFNPDEGA